MILYNHKKEFVGIEEKDLKALKLSNLAELQNEVADFADLFVKTPGYIHNFKHVHWIDFIKSADSIDENRVIISVKGRNYKAVIDLKKFYLADNPKKEAYGIVLNALRELTKEENERISGDLAHRSMTKPLEPAHFETEERAVESEMFAEVEEEPLTLDFEEEQTQEQPLQEEAPIELALDEVTLPPQEELSAQEEEAEDKFMDYRFNPELAAKELGLPTDLVEEFIQDFIAQAREFKPELYEALDAGRIDNLRMLSHKLKGVAANLRIEDAYDALVTINTSDDIALVKRTLDRFYNVIIKKLAGEEVEIQRVTKPAAASREIPRADEEKIEIGLEEDTPLEAVEETTRSKEMQPQQEEEEKIEIELDEDIFKDVGEEPEAPREEPQLEVQEEEPVILEPSAQENEIEAPLETQEERIELEPESEEESDALSVDEEIEEPLELTPDEALFQEPEIQNSPEEPQEKEAPGSFAGKETDTPSIVIEKERIASELGIDVEVYEELLGDYLSDVHAGLQQLQQLLAEGADQSRVNRLALRLKGMSDNMHLNAIAKEFEEFIQDGNADKAVLIEKIKTQLDSIERV